MAYKNKKWKPKTKEEIYQALKKGDARIKKTFLGNIDNDMDQANADQYHQSRILAASLAQQSFIMLFCANTGMGASQIAQIEWVDQQFSVVREKQGFKTIKYRAGNKEVSFLITTSFIKIFTKYLKLRDHLLKGTSNF